jgi:hypothetical protein
MKFYIAKEHKGHSQIELLTGVHGMYQNPIKDSLIKTVDTIEKSDAVLVPHDAYYFSEYPEYLEYLNEIAKFKLIVFSDRGDFPKKPRIKNSFALRTSINPGESGVRKILVPYNVKTLEDIPIRAWIERPTISFVGFLPNITIGRVFKAFQNAPINPILGNGALVRRISNNRFKKLNLEYISLPRSTYGAILDPSQNQSREREEYLDSMARSDLVLAPRGDANQSARFYETLSAGRIPLIPDTRVKFPGVDFDWTFVLKFPLFGCHLEQQILYYWNCMSKDSYIEKQQEIRRMFLEHLEYNIFMEKLFNLSLGQFKECGFSNKG